ncbi:MAG: L,D-transpeptidase family protein [Leptospiraceae bacterium]|nr:L,D-transpeptidase family protein [Leptospiraceae bacterium]
MSIACSPKPERTVADVQATIGVAARERLRPFFDAREQPWPPAEIRLLAFKQERQLELWVRQADRLQWVMIRRYPILGASGVAGPKLREGDRQVPEGIYHIEGLNPNSSYHLSMKLDYPGAFDRERALAEARLEPGTNIFVHGSDRSIGCLAMGDPAIEELFVLVADSGYQNVTVAIAPNDLRRQPAVTRMQDQPQWLPSVYESLKKFMDQTQ